MPTLKAVGTALLTLSCLAGSTRQASAICPPNPVPFTSTLPTRVTVVGLDGVGVPDPLGELLVVVRNGCNQALGGRQVEVSFVDCGATRIASSGYAPGVAVDCRPTHRSVRRLTDANGEARLIIPGTALVGGTQSHKCVRIWVEGVVFGTANVALADLDGTGGLTANDLAHFLQAFVSGDATLADFDGDAEVGANDLASFLGVFAGAGSQVTPTSLCP